MILYSLTFSISDTYGDYQRNWFGGVFSDSDNWQIRDAIEQFKADHPMHHPDTMLRHARWSVKKICVNTPVKSRHSEYSYGVWSQADREWQEHKC